MDQITFFDFNSNNVRIGFTPNNEPLFCFPDVCKAMDIKNAHISRFHFNDKGVHLMYVPTNGGNQKITFINEENLYRIVFRSTKPEAINFQNWVFSEVLPSIRKNGGCNARQTAYEELNRLCMQEKVSKDKGTFHSLGMHKRKYEKHLNAKRIQTCKTNIQLTFEGVSNDQERIPHTFKRMQ